MDLENRLHHGSRTTNGWWDHWRRGWFTGFLPPTVLHEQPIKWCRLPDAESLQMVPFSLPLCFIPILPLSAYPSISASHHPAQQEQAAPPFPISALVIHTPSSSLPLLSDRIPGVWSGQNDEVIGKERNQIQPQTSAQTFFTCVSRSDCSCDAWWEESLTTVLNSVFSFTGY